MSDKPIYNDQELIRRLKKDNIKLFEKGGMPNTPITFSGKPDGTFENALIFQNKYKVLLTEGAFFKVDTATLQVGEHTEINFDVIPFLAVTNVTVTPGIGSVTAVYNIALSQVGGKITDRKTLVSRKPMVNNSVYNFQKATTNLSSTPDTVLLATTFTDVVTGLNSDNTYWVRVAVRATNSLNRFNYSQTFEITIP